MEILNSIEQKYPIQLPSSQFTTASPLHQYALEYISMLIGASRESHESIDHIIRLELLNRKWLFEAGSETILTLIVNSLPILQSEQICPVGKSQSDLIHLIKAYLISNPSYHHPHAHIFWQSQAHKFKLLSEKAKKVFQMTKAGKISVGSLVGAALNQTESRLLDPKLKPLLNCSNIVFEKQFNELEFDENKAQFVARLLSLLDSMKSDQLSLLPLWYYWLKSYIRKVISTLTT